MAKPLDFHHIHDDIQSLLPELIQNNQDVIFLIGQIQKNLSLLSSISLDENSLSQYQMWQKTMEYIAAIKEIILLKQQQIISIEENICEPEENPSAAAYQEELDHFIESSKLDLFNAMAEKIEKKALCKFPAIHLKMLLIHHLSNFQTNRIYMLKIFYDEIEDILENDLSGTDMKVKKIRQNCIDFYYRLRKSSMRFNIFLSRASREASLADALEVFINGVILANSPIKIPHKIGKTNQPPTIDDLYPSD